MESLASMLTDMLQQDQDEQDDDQDGEEDGEDGGVSAWYPGATEATDFKSLTVAGTSKRCVTQHHIIPFIHPLYTLYTPFVHPVYTFIAIHTPMYTRYTCIYTIYTP